ncbi:thiolase [Ascobolus immersus RN42]|uniref:Thiolase n=1 Tax=Ascobolus immersus RN42 TaxID=1160509 RepID=A0A3N4IBN5_ASCIM|nr:thiolase [Ascobolus immersus RN42]
MSDRLNSILSHFKGATGVAAITSKNPDDIVITSAIRTPLTKAGRGGLKDTLPDELVYNVIKYTLDKSKIDPSIIDDVVFGNVVESNAAYQVRAAALAAGIPNTTPAHTVNRFCSSGLQAIQHVANGILTGTINIGIAGGVESMSNAGGAPPQLSDNILALSQDAQDCLQPMGQTSENVGKDFNIERTKQDAYAAKSYQRAEAAQKAGYFVDEICPVKTKVTNPKTGEVMDVTVVKDDGIRYGTTYESLAKIRPAFPEFGDKSTGGNSSQVTDGAAAVLLMKRSTAEKLGQTILAKYVGSTAVGLAPRIMGIGPSIAIPKILTQYGISKDEVDVFEINEAFASMAVYCVETLGLDHEKVNPRGGAIALGHPLGCTGTRQVVTGLSELRRTKKKILVTSMCVGTGQGMAGIFVNEVL